jgi:chromosomal replication initiator protein
MDNKKLWETVLVEIELTISPANFTTWFTGTEILKEEDGVIFIGVSNLFAKTWLKDRYHNAILRILRNLAPSVRSIEYVVHEKNSSKQKEVSKKESLQTKNTTELPLSEVVINKEDNLNPKYTFDTFVVGPFNEIAHAACQAIIKKPVAYNPLFIYGNTGLGKTHMMQAVGNHIKNTGSSKKIFYITSERFSQDMLDAMQAGKMNIFKEKYRKYDVFIMDDVQFISSKEKTQEELFHLFNYLHDNNKQIIFSSDVHPNYIQGLESRLKSRFVSGMIIDIPKPDYESRMEIIKKKAKANNISLGQDIVEFVASEIDGNVREIEGVLNNLFHYMDVKKKELTIGEVKNLVTTNKQPVRNVSIKTVVKVVAGFYNIEEDFIYDKSRKKEVVRPRQVIMYLLREVFNVSYPSIGQKMGGRDHTTVMHSYEKIKSDLKVDSGLIKEIEELKLLL